MPEYNKNSNDVTRLDANETAFFRRQLEYIFRRTYDKKYRNLKAMQLIPVSTEIPSGAKVAVWYSYSKAGQAKIINDYAHDYPRVDIYAEEKEMYVRGIGESYGYSIVEVRRAQRAGVDLDTRRANTARRANDEKVDKIAWFGDINYGLQGLLDYPGITEYTVPVGASTDTEWSTKTPDEINADLVGICNAVSVPTRGIEEVDTILLPRPQYNLIRNTRMTDGDSNTIYNFFIKNNPDKMIEVLDELQGAGAGGSDRMMAYVRDPENLTLEIPQMFEQFEADKKGGEYEIPCHSECAGVVVRFPQSVAFGDEI
jgi:hypothetical protein